MEFLLRLGSRLANRYALAIAALLVLGFFFAYVASLAPDAGRQMATGLVGAAGGREGETLGAGPPVEERPEAIVRTVDLGEDRAPGLEAAHLLRGQPR